MTTATAAQTAAPITNDADDAAACSDDGVVVVATPIIDRNNFDSEDDGEDEGDEARDSFPVPTGDSIGGGPAVIIFDPISIARNSSATPAASVATTAELASSVGSVLGMPKEAFLKSFTFLRNDDFSGEPYEWDIKFVENRDHADVAATPGNNKMSLLRQRLSRKKNTEHRLYIEGVSGIMAHSRITEGDYLKTINGKRVGPSMNAERAMERMKQCLEKDGYLSIATKNKEEHTDDILVHATIIKPRPDMTYKQLGMKVWMWGYLVIKEFSKDSIFKKTALKEVDNIISVNEIVCDGLKPEQFADVIDALPREVTVTVLRRKQRANGNFA